MDLSHRGGAGVDILGSSWSLAVWWKRKGSKQAFNANCKNTVFKYPSGSSEMHPTEKNHDLLREIILDNTSPGDTILDPCAGSGSTGYVAVKNKRNFIGYELNTGFYEKAKARLDALMDSSSWDTDFNIL